MPNPRWKIVNALKIAKALKWKERAKQARHATSGRRPGLRVGVERAVSTGPLDGPP
ncbi:hypothetical protein LB572_06295 [Mesorhizobium sp. BH1-1-5]|uniref:hypothetical protein n=1 Tax=Mesorhizobium sp. BH1-1-5 TaxID=2876661 RepID=UPI001CCD4780|nr:hypothetical protein [Mesorhizobium sp. BH1-1-5]MBZ9986704.1 hypothetical protein [Mesorhizobium sp. BH1-1-5]